MKAVMQTLFVLMLASLGLTGCGQKGDLFLPTTPPPVATPAEPAAEPAPEQQSQPAAAQNELQNPHSAQSAVPAPAGTALPDATQHTNSNTKR